MWTSARTAALAVTLLLMFTTGLAGCVYRKETERVAPGPAPVVVQTQTPQRVYNYPEGRYELRGDGTARSPYFWVWIPAGTQSMPPPPPLPSISSR